MLHWIDYCCNLISIHKLNENYNNHRLKIIREVNKVFSQISYIQEYLSKHYYNIWGSCFHYLGKKCLCYKKNIYIYNYWNFNIYTCPQLHLLLYWSAICFWWKYLPGFCNNEMWQQPNSLWETINPASCVRIRRVCVISFKYTFFGITAILLCNSHGELLNTEKKHSELHVTSPFLSEMSRKLAET